MRVALNLIGMVLCLLDAYEAAFDDRRRFIFAVLLAAIFAWNLEGLLR